VQPSTNNLLAVSAASRTKEDGTDGAIWFPGAIKPPEEDFTKDTNLSRQIVTLAL
jgi:hypothetical protein